jgi:S-layer homology domain
MRSRRSLWPLFAAAMLFAGVALPAEPPTADAPEDYGTEGLGITIFGREEFTTSDGEWFAASMNRIPNGAVVAQVAYYIRDASAAADVRCSLERVSVNSASGDGPWSYAALVVMTSDGAPGNTVVYENVELPIRYREDLDEDGDVEVSSYSLGVLLPDDDTDLLLVRVLWKRQVSPAPQAATFNDVATNHPFFQFVEALADSGITAGCGSGNYCPDQPLTRGQMAVFLAKALGLHWPWDAQ